MSNPPAVIFDSAVWAALRDRAAGQLRAVLRDAGSRVGSVVHRTLAGALPGALPQHCALCAVACGATLLCADCRAGLPRLAAACRRCALPVDGGAVCAACCARPPPWARAIAPYAYAYPVDRLLHALKYRGVVAYAPLFADALLDCVDDLPDAVVAMPLSPARQRERGYNQAAEIARPLARHLRLPLLAGLARVRDTPALAALPWRERRRSMQDAFVPTPMPTPVVRGMHVALVDDVLTTGATLRAATLALQAGGATRVDAWVVARTLRPSS